MNKCFRFRHFLIYFNNIINIPELFDDNHKIYYHLQERSVDFYEVENNLVGRFLLDGKIL